VPTSSDPATSVLEVLSAPWSTVELQPIHKDFDLEFEVVNARTRQLEIDTLLGTGSFRKVYRGFNPRAKMEVNARSRMLEIDKFLGTGSFGEVYRGLGAEAKLEVAGPPSAAYPSDESMRAFRVLGEEEAEESSIRKVQRMAEELGDRITDEEIQERIARAHPARDHGVRGGAGAGDPGAGVPFAFSW